MPAKKTIWYMVAIALLHFAFVLSALMRVYTGYGSIDKLTLNNAWDDGRTFAQIAINGYASLPIVEYRELIAYPLACRFFLPFATTGESLAIVSFLSSMACCFVLWKIYRKTGLTEIQSLVGVVFFIACRTPESLGLSPSPLPPMELLTALEGSEPLFLLFVLLSYERMMHHRHAGAAAWLAFATLTRMAGCFVALGAFLYLALNRKKQAFWYALAPAVLLGHFLYYKGVSGNFFAFFKASAEFYPDGVLTYPYHDIVAKIAAVFQNRNIMEFPAYDIIFHLFFIVGLYALYRRNRMLFCLTLPQYLLAISLNGWSHHARYYITLWGINMAYFILLLNVVKQKSCCKSGTHELQNNLRSET